MPIRHFNHVNTHCFVEPSPLRCSANRLNALRALRKHRERVIALLDPCGKAAVFRFPSREHVAPDLADDLTGLGSRAHNPNSEQDLWFARLYNVRHTAQLWKQFRGLRLL